MHKQRLFDGPAIDYHALRFYIGLRGSRMAGHTAYHADSDADDEYERSVMTSPMLATDDDTSPTESDPPSTEPTPTFGRQDTDRLSPGDSILKWTTGQCADYVSSLGLPQYCDSFVGKSYPSLGLETYNS